jgi:hypothetical protein
MDEQDRNLTPESRLSTADLAAKNPATDHEPVQSETTSRHQTSSPVMQASRVEGQPRLSLSGRDHQPRRVVLPLQPDAARCRGDLG